MMFLQSNGIDASCLPLGAPSKITAARGARNPTITDSFLSFNLVTPVGNI